MVSTTIFPASAAELNSAATEGCPNGLNPNDQFDAIWTHRSDVGPPAASPPELPRPASPSGTRMPPDQSRFREPGLGLRVSSEALK